MNSLFDLPAGRRYDVVGVGSNAVDNIIVVDAFPRYNTKAEFVSHQRLPGGEAASTMVGLKRLGLSTAYVGGFGEDADGELGRNSLSEEGVDISYCRVVPNARTQTAFIIVDRANGERTILWKRDTLLDLAPGDVPVSLASQASLLHLTPHDMGSALMMADAARSAGTPVSIDIDSPVMGYERLLPMVDICIVSDKFTSLAFDEIDPRRGLKRLQQRFGCRVAGMTFGAEGSLFLCEDVFIETGAFQVPGGCADTTGAGDAFRAGFIYGIFAGFDIKGCARAANAVAALKCRRIGAREGLPSEKELQTMLKSI